MLFVSSAWIGSRVMKLDGEAPAVELWSSRGTQVAHSNVVRVGNHIYASHGERVPVLTATDVRTGEVVWKERGFSRTNLIHSGDRFVVLDHDARLAIASMTPKGLTVLCSAEVMDSRTWTPPTLVGTTLYIRNQLSITALDLAPKSTN